MRDVFLKSKINKRRLASVLPSFNLGENTTFDSQEHSAFKHDEADIAIVSYVIEAARRGTEVIRISKRCHRCLHPFGILGVPARVGLQSPNGTMGQICAGHRCYLQPFGEQMFATAWHACAQ